MSSWAQRVHRRAADLGSVVTSCGHPGPGPYPYRLEKVKFGVPLNDVCKNDIPGPLLVLILKLNKEAPQRKDVFRAPGNQSAMKKLIHFLQAGRLVNVDNYSVYTIASVLKKFLRKIPNGVFGRNGEDELFAIVDIDNEIEQQERIHRLITSLPIYTQRLLVLLFGTFRVIASNADRAGTGMTSEALGVSVAPSFFQSCVSDGKTARMEDVLRFKAEVNVATRIMKKMIDQFATFNLFGRENYEFYARVTGRILKVEDEWICSFRFPPPPRGQLAQQNYALQLSLEAGKTWLQCECERWGLIAQEESQSTPALLTSSSSAIGNSALSLGIIPELSLLESCARLSVSLEGPGVFALNGNETANLDLSASQTKIAAALAAAAAVAATSSTSDKRSSFSANETLQKGLVSTGPNAGANNGMKHSSSCSSTRSSKSASAAGSHHHMTMDELRAVNRYAESTKSLSYLPQVHERQTQRMKTRSEWFLESGSGVGSSSLELSDYPGQFFGGSHNDIQDHHDQLSNANAMFLMLHAHHSQQQQQQQQHHLLHPHQHLHRQQQQQIQMQRMDVSGDEQDAITISTNQHFPSDAGGMLEQNHHHQSSAAPSSMMLMDTNFPPMSAGNIGLSASAESVQYPVKRPSRRGPSYSRHHPHRSSSRRNKENGSSVTTGGNGIGSGGGPGSNKTSSSASDAAGTVGVAGGGVQQQRSNSFRQKKSNSSRDCCAAVNATKLLRKPRAVSFESSPSASIGVVGGSNLLLPHPKVSLTPASTRSGGSGRGSIDEDCETIILMDTTESSSILLSSMMLDSNSSNSSNSNLIETQQTTTGILSTMAAPITPTHSLADKSSKLVGSSSPPSLHFKPPRV